jgi:hypothetical protein
VRGDAVRRSVPRTPSISLLNQRFPPLPWDRSVPGSLRLAPPGTKCYTRTMIRHLTALLATGLFCAAFGADSLTVGEVLDRQFQIADQEITSLVEAMPAEKFNFAPSDALIKGGDFQGVRTFAQQAKHLAANIYDFSSAVLGEKPPADIGKGDGPDSVQTKEQVLAYVKGAFAYGHKALLSLTEKNQMEQPRGAPRIHAAVWMMWHSMDHYGQMVEYLRMNGIVPPASRPQ